MTLLNIHELQVRKGEYEVLRGLNLTLEQGEVHALIGTNGTGKSTLAAAIMGCKGVEVHSGSLEFDGNSLLQLDLTARARASAVPKVKVSHPLAKVTHEAAIGSVDQRQMETLMAHGLSLEEAVDIIVTGILQ